MPPKEKSQPSEKQIALLEWWISQGADFGKKVHEVSQPEKIVPVLFALQKAASVEKEAMDIPLTPVSPADEAAVEKLKNRGVIIFPVARNSNYLRGNFVTDTAISSEDLQLLSGLQKQLIWLKLGYTNISDANMAVIGQLSNLTWLSLEHTPISDPGIRSLQSLQNLQYLNLVGTSVTLQGVLQLKDLKSLRSLYLYQTKIDRKDWSLIQHSFPKTMLDSGGYIVQTLATDTVMVKVKKEY
jgi:hypothetical protein